MAGIVAKDTEEKRWRAEEDARTVVRAMEIMNDKERYAACKKEIEKQGKAMTDAMCLMGDDQEKRLNDRYPTMKK